MSAVLITYDLNRPGQGYTELHKAIKALGAWWHHLDSTWIVVTRLTAYQVFQELKPVVDDNDSFLTVDITGDSYSGWLTDDAWTWLRSNV